MAARLPRQAKLQAQAALFSTNESEEEQDIHDDSDSASDSDENLFDLNDIHEEQADEPVAPSERGSGGGDVVENEEWKDKNGNLWSPDPPIERRRRRENILHHTGGPTDCAKKTSLLETWELFFPDEDLAKIVGYSMKKAEAAGEHKELSVCSLKAAIGFMYFRGANFDQKVPLYDLYNDTASSFYKTCMSKNTIEYWLRFLRFDDHETRVERKHNDRFAAVRELWDSWNNRLPSFFNSSGNITVDEQLVSSRTRSPNRIFIPQKPGKFGELIRWASDSEFRYCFRGNPYTRSPENEELKEEHKLSNKSKMLVLDLISPFFGRGYNITADRFFSSFDLGQTLLEKQLTYIGTLMTNKREIPPVLKKPQAPLSSQFAFGGNDKRVTQVCYQATKSKKVFMISTQHHGKHVSPDSDYKPDIILEYNRTKCGVDSCDQIVKRYTTRSLLRRWPMIHFQNMLDITALNVCTIFKMTNPNWCDDYDRSDRRHMLIQLAKELCRAYVIARLQATGIHSDLRKSMRKFVGIVEIPRNIPNQSAITGRCEVCKERGKSTRNSNKASKVCEQCQKFVCASHASQKVVCLDCIDS